LALGARRTVTMSMNVVSAVLRFVCGLALIGAAYVTYQRTHAQVAAGEPIQIAGVVIGASPGQLSVALWVVGVIGALLLILGVVTLTKAKGDRPNSHETSA
jgi:hypothetical protein